jgi:acetyl-CoA carboxylase biotin carboxyl carrier protein
MPGKRTSRGSEGSGAAWNLKEICELIDVLVEREISEFEMEKGGVRIRIKRGNATAESGNSSGAASSLLPAWASPPSLSPAPVAPVPPPSAEVAPAEVAEDVHILKSPIVGTFYNAPSPSAPPFVNVGDVVEVGQPLCIIEAMKLMNEIESEAAGEVVRIYVENGQPVEYGQSLFAIRTSHRI